MIRIDDIVNKLIHLIGWQKEEYETDYVVADYLTQSESGLFYQQAHQLIKVTNLASIAPQNLNDIRRSEWDIRTNYSVGNIVKVRDILYKAIIQNHGLGPQINPDYWVQTNEFSEWLCNLTEKSIKATVLRFYDNKLASKTSRAICENKTLFNGAGRLCDLVQNQRHNVVGLEIIPARYKGVSIKLNKIGFQFNKKCTFTLYIYHSGIERPIFTFKVEYASPPSMKWFDIKSLNGGNDVYLPFVSNDIDSGGSWYLVYYQDDIESNGVQAISKSKDWSKKPCFACSESEYKSWSVLSKFLEIYPFKSDTGQRHENLWDIADNLYTYDTNYGMNLDISLVCDLTDFLIENKDIFMSVLMKQLAVDVLKEFIYNANVRTNRNSINASRQDIIIAVDGDNSGFSQKHGLAYELELAYKALELSTRGISKVCLPCKNNGIKYLTV